jgi:hypothetical protein
MFPDALLVTCAVLLSRSMLAVLMWWQELIDVVVVEGLPS